jgi:hypothetical protein
MIKLGKKPSWKPEASRKGEDQYHWFGIEDRVEDDGTIEDDSYGAHG